MYRNLPLPIIDVYKRQQQVFYFDLSASVDFVNTKKVEELIKQIINELRTSKVSEEELERCV